MLRLLKSHYDRHRATLQLLSFGAGFVFDAVAAAGHGPDHILLIWQQVAYLTVIGAILIGELMHDARPEALKLPGPIGRAWGYRDLVVHFCLGTLMNLYSIFFLLSASFSSSIIFVVVLFGSIALNEFGRGRWGAVDVKVALYAVSVFCFLSLLVPVLVGRVNALTFVASVVGTLAVMAGVYFLLRLRLTPAQLRRRFVIPAAGVIACFVGLDLAGFVPPVPLAARRLAVFHGVERQGNDFVLSYERTWWKFWQTSDEPFHAAPGDTVYVFTSVFSPATFADTMVIRWAHYEKGTGWTETDRLPLPFTGGQKNGYRAYTWKDHYVPGDWRVTIETTNGLAIARLAFTIESVPADPNRVLRQVRY